MRSTNRSEPTSDCSDQEDDGLMVSFPQTPRYRRSLHDCESASDGDGNEDKDARSVPESAYSGGSSSTTHSGSSNRSQRNNNTRKMENRHRHRHRHRQRQLEIDQYSKSKSKRIRKRKDISKSIKGSKAKSSEYAAINGKSDAESMNGVSVQLNPDNDVDAKSSISCSSTSDETSILKHDTNNSFDVQKETSESKVDEELEAGEVAHIDVDEDNDDTDDEDEDNDDTADEEDEDNDHANYEDNEDNDENEDSSGSDETDSGDSSSEESEADVKAPIPYPNASKKVVYYGWGEPAYSESNFSQDDSQYLSSQDGSVKSNQMLFAEFPDRQRCDASLTESQATGSKAEDVMVEDEYDPKRPWKKRPVELELEMDQRSERSIAMSVLSGSDAGSVFMDTATMGAVEQNSIDVKGTRGEADTTKSGAQNDDEKSARSGKSTKSLNSDISELNVAKEALRISSKSTANIERQVNPRGITKLDSDFTLTAPSFRKPEPFRPGPGTAETGLRHATSSNTLNTLDQMYQEIAHNLGVPLPPNPAPKPRHRKLRSFSSMSLFSTHSLPSIIENPIHTTSDLGNEVILGRSNGARSFKMQVSDLTLDVQSSGPGIPQSRRRLNSSDRNSSLSSEVRCTPMDRRVSAMTLPDMDEEGRGDSLRWAQRMNSRGDSRGSNGDISVSTLDTDDGNQILRSSVLVSVQDPSATSKLFRLDELDDEDGEKVQNNMEHRNTRDKAPPLLTSNSDQFNTLIRENASRFDDHDLGTLEISIADSSSDEDEERPITRRTSSQRHSFSTGFQQASTSFSYRRYTILNRCTHCCRRMKQKCCALSCQNRRTIAILVAASIVAVASFAMLFVFVILNDNDAAGKDSESIINEQVNIPLPSFSPTLSPSRQFTLWPTAEDTYTKKYPPP